LRDEYTRTIESARALVGETLNLERRPVRNAEYGVRSAECLAYGLTPAEIALMWQTVPPRMPIPGRRHDFFQISGNQLCPVMGSKMSCDQNPLGADWECEAKR
jgi:hypothetical protein